MSEILTALLFGIVAVSLIRGVAHTERAYQYPFLAALIVGGFVLPQLPGLLADPFLSRSAYSKTVFMTILCLLCAIAGWVSTSAPIKILAGCFSERRLGHVAIVFSIVGSYFYVTLSKLPGDAIVGVQISGAPVIYLFFARLLTYGLVLASICYARRPTRLMLLVILFDLALYLDRIVVTGKRAETAELALIIGLAFWFHRRVRVPRLPMVICTVLGVFAMSSMSSYRDITRENSQIVLGEIGKIDVTENFLQLLREGGPEMRNAMALIDATDGRAVFDYGAKHWNFLVWCYVPTQIFGAGTKAALMIPIPEWPRNFNPATGTTVTGMSDAFQSFWYLGSLQFLLLGYVLRRIWAAAMTGQVLAQIVYILSAVPAMHAFSHQTDWVVPVWIHMLIFLGPAMAYASVSASPTRRATAPHAPTPGAVRGDGQLHSG